MSFSFAVQAGSSLVMEWFLGGQMPSWESLPQLVSIIESGKLRFKSMLGTASWGPPACHVLKEKHPVKVVIRSLGWFPRDGLFFSE